MGGGSLIVDSFCTAPGKGRLATMAEESWDSLQGETLQGQRGKTYVPTFGMAAYVYLSLGLKGKQVHTPFP